MDINSLPNDPIMLLSFVNTRMRDEHINLDEFAEQFNVNKNDIIEKLDKCGYTYNNELNKFI